MLSEKSYSFINLYELLFYMKCAICSKNIETIFLNKIVGTMMRKNSKKHYVCADCQKKYKTKEELLNTIK